MVTRYADYGPSIVRSSNTSSGVTFGTDQNQDPAFVKGQVIAGRAFADSMLTLGRVVRQDLTRYPDHSEYQRWLRDVYQQELQRQHPELAAMYSSLLPMQRRRNELRQQLRRLEETRKTAEARDRYYEWLLVFNPAAWAVLDPVVSVTSQDTCFEAFSSDESTYVRVTLPHERMLIESPPVPGTTNIDFSTALEHELARVRTYRPLDLEVGTSGVKARTSVSAPQMTQIDLPDSWVRGLIEAQSAMLLGSHVLLLRADFVADLLAVVESRRETHGPRSLRFILEPGRSVRVVVEPWGLELTDQGSTYLGDDGRTVRVWGRRRLLALAPLLPYASDVRVDLVGDGMPSYWTVEIDGVRTTIGITGWTRNDWTSKSRFSGLMEAVSIDNDLLRDTSKLLKDHGKLTADRLADLLAIRERTALSALYALCARGAAMFLWQTGEYRHRQLWADLRLDTVLRPSGEAGQAAALTCTHVDRASHLGGVRLEAAYSSSRGDDWCVVELDDDLRLTTAHCTCWHFRRYGLRSGPCRHMVATLGTFGKP